MHHITNIIRDYKMTPTPIKLEQWKSKGKNVFCKIIWGNNGGTLN
jgi:hypothetical protein